MSSVNVSTKNVRNSADIQVLQVFFEENVWSEQNIRFSRGLQMDDLDFDLRCLQYDCCTLKAACFNFTFTLYQPENLSYS